MIDDILGQITKGVQRAIDEGFYRDYAASAENAPALHGDAPSLASAVARDAPEAFLAEVKPASPTRGTMLDGSPETSLDARIMEQATVYLDHATTGISVLTERDRFGGDPNHLGAIVRASARHPFGPMPVLMKDFLIHTDQLDAAQAAGASAVLFIHHLFARGMTEWELDEGIQTAHDHGLEVLLEVDNGNAMDHAMGTEADLIGINNRDLTTLEMDVNRAPDLLRFRAPLLGGRPALALSGIEEREDVRDMQRGGASGVLVGSTLMQATDPGAAIRHLRGQVHVKLCGTGHPDDAANIHAALALGDAIGVVIDANGAARERTHEEARALFDVVGEACRARHRARLPERVVVTTSPDVTRIVHHVDALAPTHLQWHRQATADELRTLRQALPPETKLIAWCPLVAGKDPSNWLSAIQPLVDRVLLEPPPGQGGDNGGRGTMGDLDVARRIIHAHPRMRFVLAGGLDETNLTTAIRQTRPWGIDVSSGIETSTKGHKDPARIIRFLRLARTAAGATDPHTSPTTATAETQR